VDKIVMKNKEKLENFSKSNLSLWQLTVSIFSGNKYITIPSLHFTVIQY